MKFNKVSIYKLLSEFWFNIPSYQRSYVWSNDQWDILFEDILNAYEHNSKSEYFLGALVLQEKLKEHEVNYQYYDILDGQQRLTTIILLLSAIRDTLGLENHECKDAINELLFQKGNHVKRIPKRNRVTFEIRDESTKCYDSFIVINGSGTNEYNYNFQNNNLFACKQYFINKIHSSKLHISSDVPDLLGYILHNLVIIYVSSNDLEDAFRLFTVLNNRGMPLTHSDIIKAENIGCIPIEDQANAAKKWEEFESELGRDEFLHLLGYIRTIVKKEKAKYNLLKEFEQIYNIPNLNKGENILSVIETYGKIYQDLIIDYSDNIRKEDYKLCNLITIMVSELSTDWIPCYLYFYKKFNTNRLYEFVKKLERIAIYDLVTQETPTKRQQHMNDVLKLIYKSKTPIEVISSKELNNNFIEHIFKEKINNNIYGKKYAKYLLLRCEISTLDSDHRFFLPKTISIEHILPQRPEISSRWLKDFTEENIEYYKHKLGNLALLNRRKNSSLSNNDYVIKRSKYFASSMSVFATTNKIMNNDQFNLDTLKNRHDEIIYMSIKF